MRWNGALVNSHESAIACGGGFISVPLASGSFFGCSGDTYEGLRLWRLVCVRVPKGY
jgi:hypothetical protein